MLPVGLRAVPHLPEWDVSIDWSNPLTEGLVLAAFISPREMEDIPRNYVTEEVAYSSAVNSISTGQGSTGALMSTFPPSAIAEVAAGAALVGAPYLADDAIGTQLPNMASFDGISQYASFPITLPNNECTVALWHRRQHSTTDIVELEYGDNTGSVVGAFAFVIQESFPSNNAAWFAHDTNGLGQIFLNSATNIGLGEIHHHMVGLKPQSLVGTYRYWKIDGVSANYSNLGAASAGAPLLASADLNVGARVQITGAGPFSCMGIAHLLVWNRLLTDRECSLYYSDTSQVYRPRLRRFC